MLIGAPVPVAAALPRHMLDERRRHVAVEAGDIVVVRLIEPGAPAWRVAVLPALITPLPPIDGARSGVGGAAVRDFSYRVHAAGAARLRFARAGPAPAERTFRIDAR